MDIPIKLKNKFIRLMSMFSYSISLIFYFLFNSIPKTIIIQSPPLLVSFTSIFFLRSKKRKIVLNVSDLWPDAGLDLGALKKNLLYKVLKKMESFNYRNSELILGQSQEILTHVSSITNAPNLFLYRNYPNINDIKVDNSLKRDSNKIQLVYAGLLGIAQGIVELCHQLDYEGIEFHIYGSGAEAHQLKAFITKHPDLPIFYHGSVKREVLHHEIINYDLAIIPLVQRIYGSVPSKIFELAALGMPVLYFGGGEGEDIVQRNELGWVVEPKNYSLLNNTIQDDIKHNLNRVDRNSIKTVSNQIFNYQSQVQKLKSQLF